MCLEFKERIQTLLTTFQLRSLLSYSSICLLFSSQSCTLFFLCHFIQNLLLALRVCTVWWQNAASYLTTQCGCATFWISWIAKRNQGNLWKRWILLLSFFPLHTPMFSFGTQSLSLPASRGGFRVTESVAGGHKVALISFPIKTEMSNVRPTSQSRPEVQFYMALAFCSKICYFWPASTKRIN